jgi:hypothetical protein
MSFNRHAKRQELQAALSSVRGSPYTLASVLSVPPVAARRASAQEPNVQSNNNGNYKIQDANGTDWTRVANLWLDACEYAAAVSDNVYSIGVFFPDVFAEKTLMDSHLFLFLSLLTLFI